MATTPTLHLTDPVTRLPTVGPYYAKLLTKLNIHTCLDLIGHFPHRYTDYSLVSHISRIQPGEAVTIKAQIAHFTSRRLRTNLTLQKARAVDSSGQLDLTWFNQHHLSQLIKPNRWYYLAGTAQASPRGKLQLKSPDIEPIIPGQPPTHTGRIVPIYPTTSGVSSKWLRAKIKLLLNSLADQLTETLPAAILTQHQLLSLSTAYRQIHFPDSMTNLDQARFRLSIDELLHRRLVNLIAQANWQKNHPAIPLSLTPQAQQQLHRFIASLPFKLTSDQTDAIAEIKTDLAKPTSMNRLLQGDVGAGKTIIAIIAAYIAHLVGKQTIILAPTTILAQQHYQSFTNIFKHLRPTPQIALITSRSKTTRTSLTQSIIIGTHALLYRHIPANTALIVIDEQHRFGVKQRTHFSTNTRRRHPHVLTMSATPIPRTVSLTKYGHLSVSRLHHLPAGRRPVTTWLVPAGKRSNAYRWVENQLAQTQGQAYIICPFIDSSESDTLANVKAATIEYRTLKKDVFPKLKLGLVHGRMKEADKNKIICQFHQRELDILIATPVIEVGIDNPNAQIMIIEGAERFGLAQLHQLRGRVGRGELKSYCLLFTSPGVDPAQLTRLDLMTKLNSGYDLAEADLALRGSGEITGTHQHGFAEFKLANPTDQRQLTISHQIAHQLFRRFRQGQLSAPLLERLDPDKIARVSPN